MNLSRVTKCGGFYIFWFLMIFLTVSCGSAGQSGANLAQIPPTPTSGQPVEYGASLSEWAEAVQSEQVANNSNPIVVQPLDLTPPPTVTALPTGTAYMIDDIAYQEIMWNALVPADFTADAIMAKYEDELAQIEDGSAEAFLLYSQMQVEFNNAPVNESMDGVLIRLPGFIAPLEYKDDLITEFLLVPYFGACIHTPPPPANQTVLVKTAEGYAIKFEDSWNPVWIMGELIAEGTSTDLAQAGYYIENALIEPYSDSP